jgi:hypothetical protein
VADGAASAGIRKIAVATAPRRSFTVFIGTFDKLAPPNTLVVAKVAGFVFISG